MRHSVVIILLFLLNSCSFNTLFLSEEIDKVTIVRYTPYMKHHRAYFARVHLKKITDNQKYRFLYHPKKQELAVLLHRNDQYLLYNFTKPDAPVLSLKAKRKTNYTDVLRLFKHKGYVSRNLHTLGYVPSVALRRYKGVKTLMIEVKDYRRLKKRYLNAIKNYNAKAIMSIKTVLPKSLIYAHYEKYRKRATTNEQRAQLQIIANRLRFNSNLPKQTNRPKKTAKTAKASTPKKKKMSKNLPQKTVKKEVEVKTIETPVEKVSEPPHTTVVLSPSKTITKGYHHYLHNASLPALQRYLAKSETSSSLSYSQYKKLQKHARKMKEEKLLKEGSLEELIAAYKINKNPKYKKRILILMKDKREKN